MTSNPTIFANAISGQDTYDEQFRTLMADHTVESAYWELAITDIEHTLALLLPDLRRERRRGRLRLAWRSPPAWPTTPRAASAMPACCTTASPSPTCWSRCPATKEGVPAIRP